LVIDVPVRVLKWIGKGEMGKGWDEMASYSSSPRRPVNKSTILKPRAKQKG